MTFDQAAELYYEARPEYPDELFDRLVQVIGLHPGDHVLEIGAGPGNATLPLARRGLKITALEPGRRLAAHARDTLAGYPVEVVGTMFEEWAGPTGAYAAVVAATAWHWVDPDQRYQLAAQALRADGHLAWWSAQHVFPPDGDSFFDEIQEVYDAVGEGLSDDAPRPAPGELADLSQEIEASGLFDVISVDHFDWAVDYDADSYLNLLRTFSGHIAMPMASREQLFSEIRQRLASRPTKKLRRGWGAVLHIAKKRPTPR
jgi:cyclopropane fatty-acyl-phospholipid synthase-like methyltransferase